MSYFVVLFADFVDGQIFVDFAGLKFRGFCFHLKLEGPNLDRFCNMNNFCRNLLTFFWLDIHQFAHIV